LQLEFGERFGGREGVAEGLVAGRIGGGDPVHRKLRLRLQSALDGKVAVIVGLHAGQDAEQEVRAVAVAGRPVIGRQVGDLEGIVGGRDCLGFCGDDPRGRLHFHLLSYLAELQGEIDTKVDWAKAPVLTRASVPRRHAIFRNIVPPQNGASDKFCDQCVTRMRDGYEKCVTDTRLPGGLDGTLLLPRGNAPVFPAAEITRPESEREYTFLLLVLSRVTDGASSVSK